MRSPSSAQEKKNLDQLETWPREVNFRRIGDVDSGVFSVDAVALGGQKGMSKRGLSAAKRWAIDFRRKK